MTTPNTVRAYVTLDHIDANPADWNQKTWWCGTSGCFAGWTVTLAGEKIDSRGAIRVGPGQFDVVHIGTRAAQLLGFTGEAALNDVAWKALGEPDPDSDDSDEWELFSALNTRDDLGRIVEAVFGPRPAWMIPAADCSHRDDPGHDHADCLAILAGHPEYLDPGPRPAVTG